MTGALAIPAARTGPKVIDFFVETVTLPKRTSPRREHFDVSRRGQLQHLDFRPFGCFKRSTTGFQACNPRACGFAGRLGFERYAPPELPAAGGIFFITPPSPDYAPSASHTEDLWKIADAARAKESPIIFDYKQKGPISFSTYGSQILRLCVYLHKM